MKEGAREANGMDLNRFESREYLSVPMYSVGTLLYTFGLWLCDEVIGRLTVRNGVLLSSYLNMAM